MSIVVFLRFNKFTVFSWHYLFKTKSIRVVDVL